MSEETLQATIIAIGKEFYPELIFVGSTNGINLSKLTPKDKAILLKTLYEQGFVKGHEDLTIYLPNNEVIHIELKVGKNKQSKDQIAYQQKLENLGHTYYCLNDINDVFKTLNKHLGTKYCTKLFNSYNGNMSKELVKHQYSL